MIKLIKQSSKVFLILLITLSLVSCKKDKEDDNEQKDSLPKLAETFISEINEITTVSIDSKDQIDLCIMLYSCLEESYIDVLTNEDVIAAKTKLDNYINNYDTLKETDYNNNKNESLVNAFINAVESLPTIDLLTIEDLQKIIIAENNYNALSAEAKSNQNVVAKKELLDTVRAEYDALMTMDKDAYNAHKFVTSVASLPSVEELSIEDLVKIDEISSLYASLTSEHTNKEVVISSKNTFDVYLSKATILKASQEKATTFIMAVFSLPTGSGLKYQDATQLAEIEAAYGLYNGLSEFEKTINGVSEAYAELNVVKAQFEALKEPYDISKVSPTYLCLYYYGNVKKLSFNSGADPRSILIKNYGLTEETIKDNVKIYLDVYIEGGAVKGSPLFSIDITEDYNVTVDDIVTKLNELKAAGNEAIKSQGYTFTIHIESLNDQYASSEYSAFFSATQIPIV